MQPYLQRTSELFRDYVPSFVAALGVLIAGWMTALALSRLVEAALSRTTLDNRLAGMLSADGEAAPPRVEGLVARIVFWVLMILVITAFLQILGLAVLAQPLDEFVSEIFAFLPNLLSAVLLLLAAWLLARVLRFIVQQGAMAARLDERLSEHTDTGVPPVSVSRTLGETVYWLVFLLFIPAVLEALRLEGLLRPMDFLVSDILGYVPNVLGAILLFAVGWFVARLLQRIVANLLVAAGLDRLGDRAGLGRSLRGRSLSNLAGLVVYVLILIPVIIGALNALELEAVTTPASDMLSRFLLALPNMFAALLLLVLAFLVGRVVAGLVSSVLAGAGFDDLLHRSGLERVMGRPAARASAPEVGAEGEAAPASAAPERRGTGAPLGAPLRRRAPSDLAGYVVMVAVMLFAAVEALRLLEFEALATMVTQFLYFAANVLLGLGIFGLGLYLAQVAAESIRSADTPNAVVLARVARIAILVLATATALGQVGLGEDIIKLAFGLTVGAVAIAVAIAFGLGGRDVAARYLERWAAKLEQGAARGGSGQAEAGDPTGAPEG